MRKHEITEIDRIAMEARDAGMSYGQYVAKVEMSGRTRRPRAHKEADKPERGIIWRRTKRDWRGFRAFDEEGNIVGEFDKAEQAAKAFNISLNTIYNDCWGITRKPFMRRNVRFEYYEAKRDKAATES